MSTFSEKATRAKSGIMRFFKRLLVLLIIVGVGLMFFFYYATISKGVKAGEVIEISERGVIFKTYEGTIDIMSPGAANSENKLLSTFEFSIEKNNEEIYKKIVEASLSDERVVLKYEKKYVVLPWRGETKYFIVGVEKGVKPNASNGSSGF